MDQPTEAEINKMHRWFAIECNNQAWNLTSKSERTSEQDQRMISTAHAAAFHWAEVGEPLNKARAEMLLAHVHALAGDARLCVAYATNCIQYCTENECDPWDIAFAHAEMAFASAVAGDQKQWESLSTQAQQLGVQLENKEDQKVFFKEFDRIRAAVSAK